MLLDYIDKDFPASLSKKHVEFIRQDIGFKGKLITDDLIMAGTNHDIKSAITLATEAGFDYIIVSKWYNL